MFLNLFLVLRFVFSLFYWVFWGGLFYALFSTFVCSSIFPANQNGVGGTVMSFFLDILLMKFLI